MHLNVTRPQSGEDKKRDGGMVSLITLLHVAAGLLRLLALYPFPILSVVPILLSFDSYQSWLLSWGGGVLAGGLSKFTEARLLLSLQLLAWAPGTYPVLTVRLDKTSHSFRCSHVGLLYRQ